MVENASALQTVQIGAEVTPGTAVAADKLWQAMGLKLSPKLETKAFRPYGQLVNGIVVPNREWSSFGLEGVPDYNHIVYALGSILGTVAPTGTTALTWAFKPLATDANTPQTYTAEIGNSIAAQKAAFGVFTDFGLSLKRSDSSVTGTMMAQRITTGITMTATPTAITEKPMIPGQWDVWADDTSGGLGTTQLGRCFSVDLSIGGMFGGVWPIKSSAASYDGIVQLAPKITLKLGVAVNTQGIGFFTTARAGAKKYIRAMATTGTDYITGTTPWSSQLDFSGSITEVGDFGDLDGVAIYEITFEAVYDGGWDSGAFLEWTVVNSLAAL